MADSNADPEYGVDRGAPDDERTSARGSASKEESMAAHGDPERDGRERRPRRRERNRRRDGRRGTGVTATVGPARVGAAMSRERVEP